MAEKEEEDDENGDKKKKATKLGAKEERAEGDVDAESLLKNDFLVQATEWCAVLGSRLFLCEPDTLALVSDVHLRRGKVLLALKAVSIGLTKDPAHPALNVALAKLAGQLNQRK